MTVDFKKLNAELGYEFDMFLLEHPDWAEKNIPQGAIVALQLYSNPEFNLWARKVAEQQRETGQPLILVHICDMVPFRSRIIEAEVETVLV